MPDLLYYEDIQPGDYADSGPYLVHEDELLEFARKWDPRPMHLDREAAARTRFGGLIASASHTMAIRYILMHDIDNRSGQLATVAGLGAEYTLPHPVRAGDSLVLRREIVATRRSVSRPEVAVLTMALTLSTTTGLVVMSEPVAKALISCRTEAEADEPVTTG